MRRTWNASKAVAAIVLLLLLFMPSAVHAQKRVALVIGNASYQYAPALANPKNDASDVAAALSRFGFQVIAGLDLDKAALERKVREFSIALQGAEVGLFFYAGHGLQVSGQNYIVPTDAQLTTLAALDLEVMRFEAVQRIMESEDRTNILFFDACRDNPLARNLAQAMGTRSAAAIGRGLAHIQAGYGTLISFSTQPGNVALDGSGRNSPFTGALIRHLLSSNEEVMGLMADVRADVMRETNRRQVPWEHTALTGRFYFKGPLEPPAAKPTPEPRLSTVPPTPEPQLSRPSAKGSAARDTLRRTGADPENALFIETKYGEIVIKLRNDLAPQHVERMKRLAREKYYDNVPFHRVIAGFMAQTGDGARGDGTGGSKYPNLQAEFSTVPFKRGLVGMARANDPNSANSQFFIMYADGSFLNGKYTVVGEVLSGMEVVDKIKKGEPVVDPDRMIHVQVAADVR